MGGDEATIQELARRTGDSSDYLRVLESENDQLRIPLRKELDIAYEGLIETTRPDGLDDKPVGVGLLYDNTVRGRQ